MTWCVIYQVYIEICMRCSTSGHIPGIYHKYPTSTDSRCRLNLATQRVPQALASSYFKSLRLSFQLEVAALACSTVTGKFGSTNMMVQPASEDEPLAAGAAASETQAELRAAVTGASESRPRSRLQWPTQAGLIGPVRSGQGCLRLTGTGNLTRKLACIWNPVPLVQGGTRWYVLV